MEIAALKQEEIEAKGFVPMVTDNGTYFTYNIGDNTFVAIDDRDKHQEIWGYHNGKKMQKDEAEELVSKIFNAEDENEVAAIIEGFKERRKPTPVKTDVEAEVKNMAMVMRYCVREAYPIVEQEIDCGGLSETSRAQMQQKLATTLFIAAMRRGL